MPAEITKMHSQQYAAAVELLLQQKQSYFRAASMGQKFTGKAAQIVQQIGAFELVDHVRGADTPIIDAPHDVRWAQPRDKEGAVLVDKQDFLRMIANPVNGYTEAGHSAANRVIDREFIRAFFGTAKTGEEMDTDVVWDTFVGTFTGHEIDSAGAQGMTVAKLRQARKALRAAQVDKTEMLFCALNAAMEDQLLTETLAVSMDYQTKPILEDGHITRFMGFNFIQSEELPSRASTKHSAPCWAKSGMSLNLWNDVTGRVDELPTKSYSTQVYVSVTVGASRTQEKKCVEIVCAD
jgi:hypothetical protein